MFRPGNDIHRTEPLKLSERLTNSSFIKVSFGGWPDPYPSLGTSSLASGIESYELSVYEVIEATTGTLMRDTHAVAFYNYSKDITEVEIQLPEKNPMLYAIVLEVKDKADNVRQARRFVLHDNSSYVVKNDDIPFSVVSASNKTNYTWQVHYSSICYSWKNRFFNNKYKIN